jgi:glyoxylase-like metal-dependent hydrolase (beta-lactamase superfamily II)
LVPWGFVNRFAFGTEPHIGKYIEELQEIGIQRRRLMLGTLRASWCSATAMLALVLGVGGAAVAGHDYAAAAQPRAQAAKSLRLYVFKLGNIPISDSKVMFSEQFDLAPAGCCIIVGHLIVHPKGTLIWDTGVVPDAEVGKSQSSQAAGRLTVEPPKRSLRDQLAEIGYQPKDITYVAFSHLHFDHVANGNEFKDSTWIVQEKERNAMFPDKPGPNPAAGSYSELKNSRTIILANMTPQDEYDVFGDGTVMIKPAPGHTPGQQVLILKLPKTGPVMLAGDLYHFREERAGQYLPRGDAEQSRASRMAIEEYIKKRGIPLWIEHDTRLYETLRQSPKYIE